MLKKRISPSTFHARLGHSILGAVLFALPVFANAQTPQTGLPITQLSISLSEMSSDVATTKLSKTHRYDISAEVANTEATRAMGLMFRRSLAKNSGMLFVFEQASMQCFWMHNTLLPLSIAFIADNGTIINIEDMAPQTETTHCSRRPTLYALEMNQGWFSKHHIQAGAKIEGLP